MKLRMNGKLLKKKLKKKKNKFVNAKILCKQLHLVSGQFFQNCREISGSETSKTQKVSDFPSIK